MSLSITPLSQNPLASAIRDTINAIIDTAGSGGGGGGGGGGTVRDWDLTPTIVPATLSLYELPPEFPLVNDAVIDGTTVNIDFPDGAQHVGVVTFPAIPTTGKYYYYWRPDAPTGALVNSECQTGIGDLLGDQTVALFLIGGIGLVANYAGNTGPTVHVDPLFAEGDVLCVYVDVDTGSVGIKTANVDFPLASGLAIASQSVNFYASGDSGIGALSFGVATTDLGSGITPPVGYSPLGQSFDAALPVGSAPGDTLNVTVSGTWNGIPYIAGEDGAVVTSVSPAAVLPVGVTNAQLSAVLSSKMNLPVWHVTFIAKVGPGQTYETMLDLYREFQEQNIHGMSLTVDLYDGAEGTDSYLSIYFPSFKYVQLYANGAGNGTVDLGNAIVEIYGAHEPVNLRDINIVTTNAVWMRFVKTSNSNVIDCSRFEIRDFYAQSIIFNTSSPFASNKVYNCNLSPQFGSSIEVNADPSDSTVIWLIGDNPSLSVKSNIPVRCDSGSGGISVNYVGTDLAGTPVVTVVGSANYSIASLNVNAANVTTAISVYQGGICHAYAAGIGATTGSITNNFSQAINTITADGIIMA